MINVKWKVVLHGPVKLDALGLILSFSHSCQQFYVLIKDYVCAAAGFQAKRKSYYKKIYSQSLYNTTG